MAIETLATPIAQFASLWPHRAACLLVCATFPLIWVGGLVTTYDAGMAVPDWPETYGYNMFLYPWQSWIAGPFDLFIEHGHRLLGALTGLLTIALVASLWLTKAPAWLRWTSVAALALVIFQGVLGGLRVRLDERTLAMIHGCVGPLFFTLAALLAVWTSRWWREASRGDRSSPSTHSLARLACLTACLSYGQLLIGAQLRHRNVLIEPREFQLLVAFHLFMAAAVSWHAWMLLARVTRLQRKERKLFVPAAGLAALVAVQLALGCGTWVLKYGWPGMFQTIVTWSQGQLNSSGSLLQALTTTAHVAVGSLVLATSAVISLRAWRLSAATKSTLGVNSIPAERSRQGALA